MKTKVRKTSLNSYFYIRGNGIDLNQKGKIIDKLFVVGRPLTRAELSKQSDMRINAICGRVNELITDGYIREVGKRLCTETRFMAHPLVLTDKTFE